MPSYDYQCEANGQVVEVAHAMSEEILTWGQLCERLGLPLGATAADAPVKQLITGGHVVRSASLGSGQVPPCQTGAPCCGGNLCGLN
jgi:predicted nucleic acid-binding Zn ribbon protein